MNFNNVLKNKYLYYVAVALMVINVLGYVSLGSIECVLVLGGAAYLANQFTQNRTVDIFIGLFVSNILFGCGRLKEGFDTANENGSDTLKKAAQKLNGEASKDKDDAHACPAGQAKDASGKCADVKENMAKAALNGAKTVEDHEKEKKKKAGQQGFFN